MAELIIDNIVISNIINYIDAVTEIVENIDIILHSNERRFRNRI